MRDLNERFVSRVLPLFKRQTKEVGESPLATVQLRTTAAKRFKKVENATAVIRKILQVAQSILRRLKEAELLSEVYAGARYVGGRERTLHARPPLAA